MHQHYTHLRDWSLYQYSINLDLPASAHTAILKRSKAESCVRTLGTDHIWSPYLNSSVANRKELSRNMALPEGSQSLLPEDALYSLRDAVILGPRGFGGELLDLKLEENRENILSSTSHFNKVQMFDSGVRNLSANQ